MAIYGQERIGGEWWHLFCSEACARAWHPDMRDVEWFANLSVLESRLGWPEDEMEKHTLKCSCCGTLLPKGQGG
jgi:hypothetical protein